MKLCEGGGQLQSDSHVGHLKGGSFYKEEKKMICHGFLFVLFSALCNEALGQPLT